MRLLFVLSMLALAGCAPRAPQVLSCNAENAIYKLRGQPAAELRLVKPPHPVNAFSDLAARVDFQGKTDWFEFISSMGYSRDYLAPTEDPFEAARRESADEPSPKADEKPDDDPSEFIGFDASYAVLENAPQAGQPAPAHLLATGIGKALWYSLPRRELPRALWDLSGCSTGGPAR